MIHSEVVRGPSEAALQRAAEPFLARGGKLDPVFQRRMDSLIAKKKEARLTRAEAAELRKWLEVVEHATIRLLQETGAFQPPDSKSISRKVQPKRTVGIR